MPAPEIAFLLLDGQEAARHADEFAAVATQVYADPPYGWGDHEAAEFARRFAVQTRQPGFVLAEARHGGYLVGYAFGLPLRPATNWWRHLTTPLPEDVTTEYQGRTFALADLAVRAAWRRQGIGTTLYGLIMASRHEERATLTVLPSAGPAQSAYRSWGWRKIARTRDRALGSPVLDVLVLTLPVGSANPPAQGLRRRYEAESHRQRGGRTVDTEREARRQNVPVEGAHHHASRSGQPRMARSGARRAARRGAAVVRRRGPGRRGDRRAAVRRQPRHVAERSAHDQPAGLHQQHKRAAAARRLPARPYPSQPCPPGPSVSRLATKVRASHPW